MLIDTRAMGFALTNSILRHVESRVKSALGPFAERVRCATVRLNDVNADRGGEDMRCRIVVAIRRQGVEVVESTRSDLYAAVDEAASRIRRSVKRATKRHLSHERQDRQRP